MGHLKEFKIPEKYSSKWMWDTIQQIRVALNVLHDSNFPPEGLTGSRVIRKSTLPIDRLTGGEFHLPFIMLATPTTTTSTSWTNVGGIVVYDPNMWGEVKSLVFDVTGGPVSSGGTAYFRIIDSGQTSLAQITARTVGSSRYTATITEKPKSAQALLVQYRTSDSSVEAGLVSARLIVRP